MKAFTPKSKIGEVAVYETHATMNMGINELHDLLQNRKSPLCKLFAAPVGGKLYIRFSDCGCNNGRYCDAWYPYEGQKGITPEQEKEIQENGDVVLFADTPEQMIGLIKKELKFAKSL